MEPKCEICRSLQYDTIVLVASQESRIILSSGSLSDHRSIVRSSIRGVRNIVNGILNLHLKEIIVFGRIRARRLIGIRLQKAALRTVNNNYSKEGRKQKAGCSLLVWLLLEHSTSVTTGCALFP